MDSDTPPFKLPGEIAAPGPSRRQRHHRNGPLQAKFQRDPQAWARRGPAAPARSGLRPAYAGDAAALAWT
jgi:hypothetical protein